MANLGVLSDGDILKRLRSGELGLEPFAEAHLTPNGYDLTVREVVVRNGNLKTGQGVARVPPLASFLVSTREYVRMPRDLTGQLWIRSSYARKGFLAGFGKVEAGFEGELTIGAFNTNHEPVELPIGDRFCQIAFEVLTSPPEKPYQDRSGNYQGQRGVTFAREAPPGSTPVRR